MDSSSESECIICYERPVDSRTECCHKKIFCDICIRQISQYSLSCPHCRVEDGLIPRLNIIEADEYVPLLDESVPLLDDVISIEVNENNTNTVYRSCIKTILYGLYSIMLIIIFMILIASLSNMLGEFTYRNIIIFLSTFIIYMVSIIIFIFYKNN